MTAYSNPRLEAVIADWPSGQHRTTATFRIESHPTRGERGTRTTVDPRSGQPSAPKALTYARKARIVDGDDGRTYIAELTLYGHVSVMRGDMKIQHESIFENDPRYPVVRALFDAR
jgi:hypothetical protein